MKVIFGKRDRSIYWLIWLTLCLALSGCGSDVKHEALPAVLGHMGQADDLDRNQRQHAGGKIEQHTAQPCRDEQKDYAKSGGNIDCKCPAEQVEIYLSGGSCG